MWPPQNGNWPMNYMTGGLVAPINCDDLDTLVGTRQRGILTTPFHGYGENWECHSSQIT